MNDFQIGDRVDMYRNLTRDTFSIRKKGKVVEYSDFATLLNAQFVVSEKGRQRVLSSGCKNVHAVVRGELASFSGNREGKKEAYYDPKKINSFQDKETKEPLKGFYEIYLEKGKVFYKNS